MRLLNPKMVAVVFLGVKSVYDFEPKQLETVETHFLNWAEHCTTYDEQRATRAWVKYVELHMPKEYFTATIAERKVMWLAHIEKIEREKLNDYK
jgi:hypothetical protein